MKRNLAWSCAFVLGISLLAARADDWSKSYKVTGKPAAANSKATRSTRNLERL